MKKFDINTMMNKMFTKVDNVVMDVSTGQLAISKGEETYYIGSNGMITTGALFTIPVPAFAMKIQAEAIKEGDILVHNSEAHSFVTSINPKNQSLRVLTTNGVSSTMHIKNDLLTGSGWMIVKSMFGNVQSNPMLPMMLMMSQTDDKSDSSDMMYPMLMMSMMQNNGTAGGMGAMNPMMMAMMMGQGKGDMSSMLPMMMMMNGGMGMGMTPPVVTTAPVVKPAVKKERKQRLPLVEESGV